MTKVKSIISKFISGIEIFIKDFYIIISYGLLIVFFFAMSLHFVKEIYSPSTSPDFIISTAIQGVIGSATLTVLAFTYALVLNYPERVDIVRSGKAFLFSTLNFIIGLIYIQFSLEISLETSISDVAIIVYGYIVYGYIATFLFMLGIFLLILSSFSFAVGIILLLKNLLSHNPSNQ